MRKQAEMATVEQMGDHGRSKQALRLWIRLLACTTLIKSEVRGKLRINFGYTLPRFDFLAALYREGRRVTIGELPKHLMVSSGNVTGIAARLDRLGVIRRWLSPADRRHCYVELTPKGKKEFARMAKQHEQWVAAALDCLTDREMDQLISLLDKIRHNIDAGSGGKGVK